MDESFSDEHAEIVRYRGTLRSGDREIRVPLEIITRVVRLWPDTLTELEPGERAEKAIEALKTTVARSIPSLSPRFEQIITFATREEMTPLRLVIVAVDRSAPTFGVWSARLGKLRFFAESWPAGEGEHLLAATDRMVFADDMPSRLRGLVRVQEGQWEIQLVESLIDADMPPPRAVPAMVTVGGFHELGTGAGNFTARRLTVSRVGRDGEERVDILYFDRKAPHRMIRWEQAGGHRFQIVAVDEVPLEEIDGPKRKQPRPPPAMSPSHEDDAPGKAENEDQQRQQTHPANGGASDEDESQASDEDEGQASDQDEGQASDQDEGQASDQDESQASDQDEST